ncbi:hypothetical protein Q3G72_034665 [Acer saccharum]|nr:hypothetical protein Q3G72_034665 [Acer saccharum]
MSHRIADGLSFLTFIKNWAETARHPETNVICPEFVAAKVFPPKDDGGFDLLMGGTEKNIVLKRFEFRNSVIAALKERYARKTTAENHPIRPTRVEALTTLIWSCFSASTQTKIGPDKPLLLCYAINLRKRMNPPLPDNSFGNLSPEVGTISLQDTREEDCYSLVNKLRESRAASLCFSNKFNVVHCSKFGLSSECELFWMEELPPCVVPVVLGDHLAHL